MLAFQQESRLLFYAGAPLFPCPVFLRCAVHFFAEAFAEITLTVKTRAAGNFADGKVGFGEKFCCFGKPEIHKIAVGCCLEALPKTAETFGFADVGAFCQSLQSDFLGKTVIYILKKKVHPFTHDTIHAATRSVDIF